MEDKSEADDEQRRAALVDKLVGDAIASLELMGTYLGLRLGLYTALDTGPATSGELASRAGIDRRYAREWLEQQAVAGVLDVDDAARAPDDRRYRLPGSHRDVLVDEVSPYFVAPLAFVSGIGGVLPQIVAAYRSGEGVPFSAYGADMRDHIEQLNRPMFVNDLGKDWVPAIPELHERLDSEPPARVLDIACGAGWSSIAIAQAYPKVHVVGLDLDDDSIARARDNAARAGVDDRVSFHVQNAAELEPSDKYDVAFIFEALHDMARPVSALAATRRVLVAEGSVIVGDEKVAEHFTAPGNAIERLMYGFSITHCLPVGRTESKSAATGTMMRTDTIRAYAQDAGFSRVDVLPIDNEMWRFYKLAG